MSIIERAIQAARAKAPERKAEPAREVRPEVRPDPPQPDPRPDPRPDRQIERRAAVQPAGTAAPLLERPTHATQGATVPIPRLGAGGSLVTEGADRKVYEQFRRLKRPLLQCAFGPLATTGSQLIMVTSPMQGAGKTFVSINLGYVLALEKDRNVLLIDTDNLHPTLTRQVGLTGRPGLYDLIRDPAMTPEQAICLTDIPGLWVLPAGNTATRLAGVAEQRPLPGGVPPDHGPGSQRGGDPRRPALADHQ